MVDPLIQAHTGGSGERIGSERQLQRRKVRKHPYKIVGKCKIGEIGVKHRIGVIFHLLVAGDLQAASGRQTHNASGKVSGEEHQAGPAF